VLWEHEVAGSNPAAPTDRLGDDDLERRVDDRCKEVVMARVALIAALSLGIALGAPQPASAKGAVRAVIEGPGLASPIPVRGDRLAELDGSSGLFAGLWKGACRNTGGCVRRPDHLGPWYKVTYTLFTHEKVVQYIYPYASNGPIAFVPSGQRFFRFQRTVGVWYLGALPLRWSLAGLGVPLATPIAEPAQASIAPSDPSKPPLLPIVLVLLVVIVGGVIVVHSRRKVGSRRQPARIVGHP
jgi:hypothetical protein